MSGLHAKRQKELNEEARALLASFSGDRDHKFSRTLRFGVAATFTFRDP